MKTEDIIAKLKESGHSTDYDFIDEVRGWAKFAELPLEFVTGQVGEDARWGSRDWFIHRNTTSANGDLIGIQVYVGATEDQEDEFEGVVKKMVAREVTETKYFPIDA